MATACPQRLIVLKAKTFIVIQITRELFSSSLFFKFVSKAVLNAYNVNRFTIDNTRLVLKFHSGLDRCTLKVTFRLTINRNSIFYSTRL